MNVGPYELVHQLGGNADMERWLARGPTGAMIVEVWTAVDPSLRGEVALEGRSSAVLDHRQIARVVNSGESEQPPGAWIALAADMADDLHTIAPLPPRFAARVVHDAAEAVAYAQTVGRLHGALTGHHVLVGYDGITRVTAFGAARVVSAERIKNGAIAPGTAARLSPELCAGSPTTHATDVFALGRLLAVAVGDAEALPVALRAVHDQCTQVEPSSRMPSATSFAGAVREAADRELGSMASTAELASYLRDALHTRFEERGRQWAGAAVHTNSALAPVTFNVPRDPSNPGSSIPIFDAAITSLFVRERSGAEAPDPLAQATTITGTWAALSSAFTAPGDVPVAGTPVSTPPPPATTPARGSVPPGDPGPRDEDRDGATIQVVSAMVIIAIGAFLVGMVYVGPLLQARLSEAAPRAPVAALGVGPDLPPLAPPDPALWVVPPEGPAPAPTPAPPR